MDNFCFSLLYFRYKSAIEIKLILLLLYYVIRYDSVATLNGQRKYFSGQKEPFAFLVSGSYAQVRLRSYYYYQTTLKAFYATMNNSKYNSGKTSWLIVGTRLFRKEMKLFEKQLGSTSTRCMAPIV